MPRTVRRVALSAAVAIVLLCLLFWWGGVSWAELVRVARRLPPSTYIAALCVHAGIYVLRSLRFRVLLPPGERPSPGSVLAVAAAHNLAAYVLPAKSGEASLVVYLKAHGGVSAGAALASLVVSRLLDLATLAAALALACLLLAGGGSELAAPAWVGPAGGALLGLTLALAALSARVDLLVGGLERATRALGVEGTRAGTWLLERVGRVREALRAAGGQGRLLAAALLSAGVWLGVFVFYAILARGFGLAPEVGLAEATFGSSLAVATNLLPVNAMAGFGTQETGWVLGFGLLGVERDLALSTGVGVHLVQLLNVCLMGALGHLAMGLLPGRRPSE